MKHSGPFVSGASRKDLAGFTFVEIMVALAISVIVLGATIETFIGLQHSFQAALYQVDAQADQNRVLGYISRDLRNASTLQLSAAGTDVTVTIPVQNAPTLNLNLGLPLLSLLSGSNPASPKVTSVRYYRQGTTIIRKSGTQSSDLSSSATRFVVTQSGTMAQVITAFQPQFALRTTSGTPPLVQVSATVYLMNLGQAAP